MASKQRPKQYRRYLAPLSEESVPRSTRARWHQTEKILAEGAPRPLEQKSAAQSHNRGDGPPCSGQGIEACLTTGHLSETDCSGPTSRQSEISLAEMSPVLLSGEIPQTESMCEEAESPCSADSLSSFSVSSPGSSECEEKDIQSEGEQPGSPTEHVSDAPSAFSVKGFDLTTQICKCTTTTVAEVLVLLLSFLAKHRPTVSALVDILQLFNVVFQKDILPSTKYLFNKAFSSPSLMMQYHMYSSL
ncbi:uncharacterized protein ISCGN_018858 [Ixodes scapularis]